MQPASHPPADDATAATRIAGANNDATAPTVMVTPASAGSAATVVASAGTGTTSAANSLDALVGRSLGGCRIDTLLGRGGMGAVFRAHQESLGRSVALKVMLPGRDADPQFAARFQREARVVASLNHPHVVQVFDTGRAEDGMLYLVMEFVDGRSLAQVIRDQGALPVSTTLAVIRQAAEGLAAADAKGLVHRDIKPDNLMIDADARVKVMDFGLARPTEGGSGDSALTMSGMILGTPNYISPEAARGESADIRADLYSLGVTLWQCIAGKLPFTGPTPVQVLVQHIEAAPPALNTAVAECPRQVVDLCNRLLAKAPAQRPVNPAALVDEITAIEIALCGRPGRLRWDNKRLSCDASVVRSDAVRAPAASRGRGRAIAAIVALVVLGGGGLLWWQGSRSAAAATPSNPEVVTQTTSVATRVPADSGARPAEVSPITPITPPKPGEPAAVLPADVAPPVATVTQQASAVSDVPAVTTHVPAVVASVPDPTPVEAVTPVVTTTAATSTPAQPEVPTPAQPEVPAPAPALPAPDVKPAAAADVPIAAAVLKPLAVIPPPQPQRPAKLFVSSIPSGATVDIDGVTKGTTPAHIDNLKPGEHRLRVHGNGVDDATVIVLPGGSLTRVNTPLPQPARLTLLNLPKGVPVTVDGRPYLPDMAVITGTITVQVVTAEGTKAFAVTTEPGRNVFGYE